MYKKPLESDTHARKKHTHTTTNTEESNKSSNNRVLEPFSLRLHYTSLTHDSLVRWAVTKWRALQCVVMRKSEWRTAMDCSQHSIRMVVWRKLHRKAALRGRTVHVGSGQRRRSSVHSVHTIDSTHAVHSTHEQMWRGRHIWRKWSVKPVEQLERHWRSINARRWQKCGGWRGTLLMMLGSGETRGRGHLSK
jgi:hypothetical protein